MIKFMELKINKLSYPIVNISTITESYRYINFGYDFPPHKTKALFSGKVYDNVTIKFDWLNYKQKAQLKKLSNNHFDVLIEHKKRTIFGSINSIKNQNSKYEITVQINYILYGNR